MPFQKGNQHAAKDKLFARTLKRAIDADDGKRIRAAAEKILDLAEQGERWACEFIRDTLDGRPATNLIATDDTGKELAIAIVSYQPPDPVQVQPKALPTPGTEGTGLRH